MRPASQAGVAPSLLFRARGHLCALPLGQVVETMRPLPVEPMSGAPWYVAGLAVIRGVAVPVVEMSRWFDGAATGPHTKVETGGSSSGARFVTVRVGDHVVALAVDTVVGIRTLAAESLDDLPPLLSQADSDAIASVGTLDAELLLCLRTARLVPGEGPRAFAMGAPG